ncbi:hypothetical protein PC117_g17111 [Phytophthora cactorum]|uniref:Uncharacterized protein n=1 Tax=Phytophthora cactorum TaxID=29920 RepID=A0A8T1CC24_9STRA|nr:hypothetical protein PC117_g17111 [Phytophthora cactorum]KAG3009936.1 hypothetical protein PC120_g15332 [Phytophthora cactorum]
MLFGTTRISRGKLSATTVLPPSHSEYHSLAWIASSVLSVSSRLVEESKGVTKKISRCWSPRRSMSSLSIKLPESLPNTFQIKDRQIIK